jgi:erythromycin esterase
MAISPPGASIRPSDAAITAWLRANATPLVATTPLASDAARAFETLVGSAPLVAMGEATHGSADFPDWRARVFEALVRDRGFSVYAVEVGYPDALALDDFVVTGRGDPVAAIHALLTTKDETRETLALVQWMRAYNADPSHTTKVHFEGFDVYTPHAVPRVLAYLAKVDPFASEEAHATLAPFTDVGCDETYPALPAASRDATRRAIAALIARFDAQHTAYAARTSEDEWERVRRLVRIVQQAEISYGDYGARDAQMVENVGWLLGRHERGTKVFLDAHNAHVSAVTGAGHLDFGAGLRRAWGADYFAFGSGSFLALDERPDMQSRGLLAFTVPPAASDTFDGSLAMAGLSAFVIDLRSAQGEIAAWLRAPQRMHHVGMTYDGKDAFGEVAPGQAFDAVVYLDRIEAMHSL